MLVAMGLSLVATDVVAKINVEEVRSKSGIKALLVQDKTLPLIAISFAFRGGTEQDSADKQGLSKLATELLTQGAGEYDADAFQSRLADKSITLNISAGRDAVFGSIKTLRTTRAEAFRMLRLALTEPRFDPISLQQARDQQMTRMRHDFGDPDWQARNRLFQSIFGAHPYGRRRLGTVQTLSSITREDVQTFVAQRLGRDNLIVAAAGDISALELRNFLDRVFGDLPEHANLQTITRVEWPEQPTTSLVKRTGTQSNLLFAMPMLNGDDPDWYAAEVANYILGGGDFSSRLMREVRENAGLTYGISTGITDMQAVSLLVGGVAVGNADAARTYDLVKSVWQDLLDNPPSETEVEAAKNHLAGSLPLSLTSTDALAGFLVGVQLHNRPSDYAERHPALIRAVTVNDVQRVLQKWFDPSRLSLAVVGEPAGLDVEQTFEQVTE